MRAKEPLMTAKTIETLKWFIGVPASLLALLTLPYVMQKYHLECRKLRYELSKLESDLGGNRIAVQMKRPGALFNWMAHYWPIPCYGSMLCLSILAAILKSPILIAVAFGSSLMFFVVGSAIEER